MLFPRILSFAACGLAAPTLHAMRDAKPTPNQFIVVMKQGAAETALQSTISAVTNILGGTAPRLVHSISSFKGMTVSVGDESSLASIGGLENVDYIEPDTKVSTQQITQTGAPWGLGRISHREPGSTNYIYDKRAGEGTFSYIIDTGIFIDHLDFNGRATWGANFADDGLDRDGNGHGTHCAGITGGTTYGVAKKTQLIAVKVLDSEGNGANSGVIAGIQWAVDDAISKGRIGKAVANLSLGGPRSIAANQAAAAAVEAGLFLAVAAGNDGTLARLYSPASEPTVCTVAASDIKDTRADFSNFGSLVDIFAPGVDILSAWNTGRADTNTISGTSMATPHVAGLAAYLLALEGPCLPQALCERIRSLATLDVIKKPGLFSPNLLAFNGVRG